MVLYVEEVAPLVARWKEFFSRAGYEGYTYNEGRVLVVEGEPVYVWWNRCRWNTMLFTREELEEDEAELVE